MIGPSLSVVQTVPSSRRKLAPALSSPPKQQVPSNSPGANHLKPTGTSLRRRSCVATTRSIRLLLTSVLPTAAVFGQLGGGGIVGEGDTEFILEADEPRHRIGARAVHANLAVMIDGHE